MAAVLIGSALLFLAAVSWGEAHGGVFLGAGLSHNRIIDPTGWAYWGRRGWATDYDDADLVGGGPREACPYKVENHLAILRLALVRRFEL